MNSNKKINYFYLLYLYATCMHPVLLHCAECAVWTRTCNVNDDIFVGRGGTKGTGKSPETGRRPAVPRISPDENTRGGEGSERN